MFTGTGTPLPPDVQRESLRLICERTGAPAHAADEILELQAVYPHFTIWWSHGQGMSEQQGPGFYAYYTDGRLRSCRAIYHADAVILGWLLGRQADPDERLRIWGADIAAEWRTAWEREEQPE